MISFTTHRLAAMLWLDLDPGDRRNVCHRCDNAACFNPEHLYLGSALANARDRAARGRGRENDQAGRKNPNAKLTGAQVREIIRLTQDGYSQEAVAKMFGIRQPHVSRLVRRVSWVGLPDVAEDVEDKPVRKRRLPASYNRGEDHPSATLTEARVQQIRALVASGVPQVVLAQEFGMPTSTMGQVVTRRSWRHLREPTSEEIAASRAAWDAAHVT